jgi:hypothetical protein
MYFGLCVAFNAIRNSKQIEMCHIIICPLYIILCKITVTYKRCRLLYGHTSQKPAAAVRRDSEGIIKLALPVGTSFSVSS